LMHELSHIRRHDYLVNALQRLVESFFFYHPATWWISSVMRDERENCCDDVVVSLTGNAHEYAVVLAALERKRVLSREPAIAATGGHLMKRVQRLLHPPRSIGALAPVFAVAILFVTTAGAMAALRLETPKRSPGATTSGVTLQVATIPASTSTKPVYSKWIDEDVVYIIDDAERAAFLSLASDDERDHFIQQFWDRRNPTPGSAENGFKEEHYRRIAYANKHFQTPSGVLGWRTDRGHMYIVFGPPDEIEAHAKGQQKPFATEVWLYRHVEGVGENGTVTFVDRKGRGDFHLAPGNGAAK
jgi:GWxTD domain-containing protein